MARVLVFGSYADSLVGFRGAMLQEMVANGHQTYACAPNASEEIRNTLAEWGVSYMHVDLDRTGMSPVRDTQSLTNLVRVFRKINPDMVFGYTIKPVIYGSLAARMAGAPNIFSLISGLGYAFSGTGVKARAVGVVARKLYGLALNYNSKVFFQNPDNLRLFATRGLMRDASKAVLVNGSGVDINVFTPAPFPRTVSFLLIARLIRQKGIYEYVAAAREIKNKYPEVKFRLAGFFDRNPAAIKEKDLKSWIDDGTIECLGHLRDVRQAIGDTSVYVLPSFYPEGTPRSILEAMAMGRPIITTDTPGCRETVAQKKNGFLIPAHNVTELTRAMEHFINHRDDIGVMGEASRRMAVEKYDVHKVNNVILNAMGLV